MKRCRRDDKPVAIWSFAELGATFQVTVSLLYDQELLLSRVSQTDPLLWISTSCLLCHTAELLRWESTRFLVGLSGKSSRVICLSPPKGCTLNVNIKTSFTRLWEFPKTAKVIWGRGCQFSEDVTNVSNSNPAVCLELILQHPIWSPSLFIWWSVQDKSSQPRSIMEALH